MEHSGYPVLNRMYNVNVENYFKLDICDRSGHSENLFKNEG